MSILSCSFEGGGLELVKSALLVWCPSPYTTVLCYQKQFRNFPIKYTLFFSLRKFYSKSQNLVVVQYIDSCFDKISRFQFGGFEPME
jgi:hypothetical protein